MKSQTFVKKKQTLIQNYIMDNIIIVGPIHAMASHTQTVVGQA
jgi:hypothetical protein